MIVRSDLVVKATVSRRELPYTALFITFLASMLGSVRLYDLPPRIFLVMLTAPSTDAVA